MAAAGDIDPMHQFVIEPIFGSFQRNNPFVLGVLRLMMRMTSQLLISKQTLTKMTPRTISICINSRLDKYREDSARRSPPPALRRGDISREAPETARVFQRCRRAR